MHYYTRNNQQTIDKFRRPPGLVSLSVKPLIQYRHLYGRSRQRSVRLPRNKRTSPFKVNRHRWPQNQRITARVAGYRATCSKVDYVIRFSSDRGRHCTLSPLGTGVSYISIIEVDDDHV